jgi:hypothetical protein
MSERSKDELRREAQSLGRTEVERAVLVALSLFQNNYGADEKCPKCGTLIDIEPCVAWTVDAAAGYHNQQHACDPYEGG